MTPKPLTVERLAEILAQSDNGGLDNEAIQDLLAAEEYLRLCVSMNNEAARQETDPSHRA